MAIQPIYYSILFYYKFLRKKIGRQERYELQYSNKVFTSDKCESRSVVLQHHGLHSPWNSPGHNTGVGSLSLLPGIFPTQGSNPSLPHCRRILYQQIHKGSPPLTKTSFIPTTTKTVDTSSYLNLNLN